MGGQNNNSFTHPSILMPTIAQQLCQELVEPVLKASANSIKSKVSKKSVTINESQNEVMPTRSVCIERKNTTSRIVPVKNSKPKVNTLKSKETILKKNYIDTFTNTIISGPLTCDNYCVTKVQRRDRNACKCSERRPTKKTNNKVIQVGTKSISRLDKACDHTVTCITCGTQVYVKENCVSKPVLKRSKSRTNINFNIPYQEPLQSKSGFYRIQKRNSAQEPKASHAITESGSSNAGKRWAVSDFPIRGPDF